MLRIKEVIAGFFGGCLVASTFGAEYIMPQPTTLFKSVKEVVQPGDDKVGAQALGAEQAFDLGLSISRDFLEKGPGSDPAEFSYTDSKDGGSTSSINASFGVYTPTFDIPHIPLIGATLTSFAGIDIQDIGEGADAKDNRSAYLLFLVQGDKPLPLPGMTQKPNFYFGPVWTKDRLTQAEEFRFAFEWQPWGLGDSSQAAQGQEKTLEVENGRFGSLAILDRTEPLDYMFQPIVGIDIVDVTSDPTTSTTVLNATGGEDAAFKAERDQLLQLYKNDLDNGFGRIGAKAAVSLGERFKIQYEATSSFELNDTSNDYFQQTASLEWALGNVNRKGEFYSLSLNWKDGEALPDFKDVEIVSASFKVRL